MDILETNERLKKQLEVARKTAIQVRDSLKATDPMDVVYINLALETVDQRARFHRNSTGKKPAEMPANKSKAERRVSE